jgi:hypothetical protein
MSDVLAAATDRYNLVGDPRVLASTDLDVAVSLRPLTLRAHRRDRQPAYLHTEFQTRRT